MFCCCVVLSRSLPQLPENDAEEKIAHYKKETNITELNRDLIQIKRRLSSVSSI